MKFVVALFIVAFVAVTAESAALPSGEEIEAHAQAVAEKATEWYNQVTSSDWFTNLSRHAKAATATANDLAGMAATKVKEHTNTLVNMFNKHLEDN